MPPGPLASCGSCALDDVRAQPRQQRRTFEDSYSCLMTATGQSYVSKQKSYAGISEEYAVRSPRFADLPVCGDDLGAVAACARLVILSRNCVYGYAADSCV